MADNPKKKGRAYLMRTAKVTRQKALEAIRDAGPNREKVMEYLGKK